MAVVLSWSGGKDCIWALAELRRQRHEVAALVTTFDQRTRSVPIHNVPIDLIERQAGSLGVPLWTAPLPWPCSNPVYAAAIKALCARARAEGCDGIAFGDLFLEDIREFRLGVLDGTGLSALFPIWGTPTADLARRIIASGYRARIVAAREPDWIGRDYDEKFLDSLPRDVDPCGERGEFHTFVHDGPGFRYPVPEAERHAAATADTPAPATSCRRAAERPR